MGLWSDAAAPSPPPYPVGTPDEEYYSGMCAMRQWKDYFGIKRDYTGKSRCCNRLSGGNKLPPMVSLNNFSIGVLLIVVAAALFQQPTNAAQIRNCGKEIEVDFRKFK